MRTPLVAANWKMYKTVAEAVVYAKELRVLVKDLDEGQVVLAPPFTALHAVAEAVRNTPIAVAAQNVHFETEGAFTGEISPRMVREAGAERAIIGHSERRRLFGETDELVARKVRAAIEAELAPILCIGETLEERDSGQTFAVLDRQMATALDDVTAEAAEDLVVAYEPVWAIGTGRNATPGQAQEAHAHIRRRLRERLGDLFADDCRIMYGGSVKPANAAELAAQPDVDGALVGGASLDVRSFLAIVEACRT